MKNTTLTLSGYREALEFRRQGHWGDDSIYEYVRKQTARAPQAFAIRDASRRLTYAQLLAQADQFAAMLHARGVRAGERVAIWLPSCVEVAAIILACSRNGYICCPSLHRDHTVADVAGLLARMRASVLIARASYGADARKKNIFVETAGLPSLRAAYDLDSVALTTAAQLDPAPRADDPDSIVYLAFTSGTTGEPKGVMHSDNTLLANALAMSSDWNLGADGVTYSMSPLSHNLGIGALVMTLVRGGEFVVHDLARGASLVDRIVETNASFVIGVPTHAIDMLAELRRRKMSSLGRVKGFRISGASVPPSVAAGLLEHGVTPQSGFGMTEAGSHHYTLPNDDPSIICETSGRVCASYEVKIFKAEDPDEEAAPGEAGQICGRGASLMLGYFDDQASTEASFNASGWFITGDLGWIDEKGCLRVTGRKKDIIIRGGHNIYPAKIEGLTLRHTSVLRAAAVPVADERLGEKVCLAIACRPGHALSADEVLGHLDQAGLSKFDMPEYFLALDDLPLTASGKILKRELVRAIVAGELTPQPVRFMERA
ncbi:MAG: acyl--CoA ligase [Beijerinckiaceae bacterium]|nr:acyl--CoA ligase [Beijerinckiaceae bacterium]